MNNIKTVYTFFSAEIPNRHFTKSSIHYISPSPNSIADLKWTGSSKNLILGLAS